MNMDDAGTEEGGAQSVSGCQQQNPQQVEWIYLLLLLGLAFLKPKHARYQ